MRSASRLSRSVSPMRLFVDAIHFIHGRAIVSPEATDLVAESVHGAPEATGVNHGREAACAVS